MNQLHFNLDTLSAKLTVLEGGREVHYRLTLSPDRAECGLSREVCEGYLVVESVEERLLLRELCADQSRDPALTWAARGFLGIPLRFGKAE